MTARAGASAIEAVTFDYWDTLMYVEGEALRDGRLAVVAELLADIPLATLQEAHLGAFRRYQSSWRANRQFCAPDAIDHMLTVLGLGDQGDRQGLIEAFSVGGLQTDLRPAAGIRECLEALRAAGVGLGIVCDVGLTPSSVLLAHLDRQGLLGYFDSWSFSDEVGVYKPDPAIFTHALAGLGGVPSTCAAHVGDRRRTDVAGARASGMTAVRYTGIFDDSAADEPDAPVVIGSYDRLPELLGVGT